jgi:hypothetical protein
VAPDDCLFVAEPGPMLNRRGGPAIDRSASGRSRPVMLSLTIPESGRRPSVSPGQLNQFFARYHDSRSRDKSGYLWMIADMQLRISVVLVCRA